MGRLGERGIGIAVAHAEFGQQIVRRAPVHDRGPRRERRAAVGDRGQRIVFDLDQRGAVLGDVAVVGDHDRHRLADVHHFVDREHGAVQVLLVALARKTDDEPLVA